MHQCGVKQHCINCVHKLKNTGCDIRWEYCTICSECKDYKYGLFKELDEVLEGQYGTFM